jgi:splicing factor U2AF subunit
MADHLASIYGTERDKVNCAFYFKIGACRHGETCSRKHVKPQYSPTVLLPNMYLNPANDPTCTLTPAQLQQHFDLFYEDIFMELATKYGHVEEMLVCDNLGDHLIGNIYVRFEDEAAATRASEDLNKRWYAGRPIFAELCPVTEFKEACCRQYELNECTRGGYCNFMHFKYPSMDLKRELLACQRESDRRSRQQRKSQD